MRRRSRELATPSHPKPPSSVGEAHEETARKTGFLETKSVFCLWGNTKGAGEAF